MEQTLQALQTVEGQSVELLEQQVVESKKVLKQLQGNHAGRLLQNFLTVLFQVKNQDQDMILDDDDIEALISRLEGLHGNINVNDELLRRVIVEQGRSIQAVMQIAKNIIQGSSSGSSGSTGNSGSSGGVGGAGGDSASSGSTAAATATDITKIFTVIQDEDEDDDDDDGSVDSESAAAAAVATTSVEHGTFTNNSNEKS
jgi:hypothetical protein